MSSACIFGSMARNRFDKLSDRDVLIVGEGETAKWRDDGWSVAEFSEDQVLGMASSGSLFVQHLKQEGIIVRDDSNFLAGVLREFLPRCHFRRELDDSYALLGTIRSGAGSYWAWLCSCDIAYVAIRNIGIHLLAAKGMYIFDFNDIVDRLSEKREVSIIKLKALKRLRFLKYAYRNRLVDILRDDTLERALEGAEELFETQISPRLPTEIAKLGYNGLRVLELSLVQRLDPRSLDTLAPRDVLSPAWSMISDPRGYPKPWKIDPEWISGIAAVAAARYNAS